MEFTTENMPEAIAAYRKENVETAKQIWAEENDDLQVPSGLIVSGRLQDVTKAYPASIMNDPFSPGDIINWLLLNSGIRVDVAACILSAGYGSVWLFITQEYFDFELRELLDAFVALDEEGAFGEDQGVQIPPGPIQDALIAAKDNDFSSLKNQAFDASIVLTLSAREKLLSFQSQFEGPDAANRGELKHAFKGRGAKQLIPLGLELLERQYFEVVKDFVPEVTPVFTHWAEFNPKSRELWPDNYDLCVVKAAKGDIKGSNLRKGDYGAYQFVIDESGDPLWQNREGYFYAAAGQYYMPLPENHKVLGAEDEPGAAKGSTETGAADSDE